METPTATVPTIVSEKTPSTEAPASGRLTLRAMLLALVVQVAAIFWVVRTEVTGSAFVSNWALPMPAVLVLLVLLLLNRMRRRPWGQAEVLLVYLTLTSTIMLVGYHYAQVVIPMIAYPFYKGEWSRMHQFLPTWLTVRDPDAVNNLFLGNAPVPWRVWLAPLAAWTLLLMAISVATLSLSVLLSRQWIHRERITFPVATLPLELVSSRAPLLRSRALWVGFGLAAVGQSLCALNYYMPSVPAVPLTIGSISDWWTEPPWTALGAVYVRYTPFCLGLAFLAPMDVAFSVWFFFWMGKLQRLLTFNMGFMDPNNISETGAPYLTEQAIGAYLMMGLFLLWRVLSGIQVFRSSGVRDKSNPNAERRTPNAERLPLLAFVAAVAVIVTFLMAAGMAFWLAAGLLTLYFLMLVTLTRMRAEAGFPWLYGPNRWAGGTVTHMLGNTLGSNFFLPSQLTAAGFFHWLWWDVRFTQMPGEFEALKIGDIARIRQRHLVAWIVLVSFVAIVVGLYAGLRNGYQLGWATAKMYGGTLDGARTGYELADRWWTNPVRTDTTRTAASCIGAAATLGLIMARQQFMWWPFNPIGYVMGGTNSATMFWSDYFVAWLLKGCLIRYGGMRLYRAAIPFFVGLILGDLATQAAWSLASSILDVPIYQFLA